VPKGGISAGTWLGSLGDVYELYPFYGLCVFTLEQTNFLFYNVQCTFFILWWFFLLLPPSARLGVTLQNFVGAPGELGRGPAVRNTNKMF
jgi:hypothetical protein